MTNVVNFDDLIPSPQIGRLSDPQVTVALLSKLIEENVELMEGYDEENAMLSAIIGGSAEAMDERPQAEKGAVIASAVQMLDSVRVEYDMLPKLFAFFIELCLEQRKFIIPVLAFAVCLREEDKVRKLEQDEALTKELAWWMTHKLIPSGDLLHRPTNEAKPAIFTPTQCWRLTNGQYLLQGTAEPLPSGAASIRLPNGEVIHQAAPYHLVTATGHVISSYPTPRCYSFEETLYMTDIHAVSEGQLCNFSWQQQADNTEKVKAQIVNLPAFLRACECNELPFDPAPISSP